jgi:hypothetical protein
VKEPRASGGIRRSAFVAAVSAASAGLSWLFFCAGVRGLWYDSYHYFALSQIVSGEGLWNLQSRVRTYGYPLFVSLCTGFSDVEAETARALVFAAQLLLYLAISLYAARVAERVFGSARFFYGTYLVMALNPIVLIRSTELLSDTLSATLIFLAVLSRSSGPILRGGSSWLFCARASPRPCARLPSSCCRRLRSLGSSARGSTTSRFSGMCSRRWRPWRWHSCLR